MATQSSQGVAARLGYGLGRGVRFFLFDRRASLQTLKRIIFFGMLLFCFFQVFSWFIGASLSIVSFGLILLALAKGDFSTLEKQSKGAYDEEDGYRYGLFGYGYYVNGVRTDSDQED